LTQIFRLSAARHNMVCTVMLSRENDSSHMNASATLSNERTVKNGSLCVYSHITRSLNVSDKARVETVKFLYSVFSTVHIPSILAAFACRKIVSYLSLTGLSESRHAMQYAAIIRCMQLLIFAIFSFSPFH
jgi:hypothetical protein